MNEPTRTAGSLPSNEALCALSATELAAQFRAKALSPVEVAEAYLRRIERVDPMVGAYTTVLRESALAEAREAETRFRAGEDRGPLQGIPLSVKECYGLEGQAITLGIPSRRGHRAERDAALVQLARAQGAVLLGRANLSQLMLSMECFNPVFGRTANPHSLAHTPGGSSGGDAAALAAGMSALALGTDIGGSIRIPAAFTGTCGLKPTLDRWSVAGIASGVPGQELVRGQSGPMGRTVADVMHLFDAFEPRAMSALDGRVPPIAPENPREIAPSSLRVGLLLDNGVLTPSLAVLRGVHRAGDLLRDAGATVVPFTPPEIPWAIAQFFRALSSDGARTVLTAIGRDPIDPNLASMRALAKLPRPARRTAVQLARLAGETLVATLLEAMGEKSVSEVWALTYALRTYRLRVERAFREANIDLVLSPAFATPAVPHGEGAQFQLAASYTMLWNVLQFPAGVVPVTRVRTDEAVRMGARQRPEKTAEKIDRASVGLPVGVQLAALPWREALVLRAMQLVEEGARGDDGFPASPVEPR